MLNINGNLRPSEREAIAQQGLRRVRKRLNGRQPLPWAPCSGPITEAQAHLERSSNSSGNDNLEMDTSEIASPMMLRCHECADGRKLIYTALVDGFKWKRILCPSCKTAFKASLWHCNCDIPWVTCSTHRSKGFKLQAKVAKPSPTLPRTPSGAKVRKLATLGASAASIRKRESNLSLHGTKSSSNAKRRKATASAPMGSAMASTPPAPPLGATSAEALQSNHSVSITERPRPRVAVTVPATHDGNTGVVALSRAQIATSPLLQQYAKRGIIRMASMGAQSHSAGTTMHANHHSKPSKRRCTGTGVNTPLARPALSSKRILNVGDDSSRPAKRHCEIQHLNSSLLPRPPETGVR